MKTRFLSVSLTLSAVVCLSISLFAQRAATQYPVKVDALKAGDMLRLSLFKQPYLVTGTGGMDLTLNLVVREDGRLNVPPTMRLLADLPIAGLTVAQLRQVLERRIAENNYETRVAVLFTGSNGPQ